MLFLRLLAAAAAIVIALGHANPSLAQDPPAATAPAALELYGRLPAFSSPKLSPDGRRLAYLTPVDGSHALVITDLSTLAVVGGLRSIENKVRSIDWIGNDHLLISTSTTATIPSMGVRQSELSQALIYKLADRSVRTVFARNPELMRVLFGAPMIRDTPDGAALFAEGLDVTDFTRNLYRIDPATNRAVEVERGLKVDRYLLDPGGVAVARTTYDGERGAWGLEVKRAGLWPRVWTTTAPLDQPSLIGFGRDHRSVVVQAVKEGEAEPRYHEISLDTGAWADLGLEGEPSGLLFHPVSRLLFGAVLDSDNGPAYVFFDPAAGRVWRSVARAFQGRPAHLMSWASDLRSLVVFTDGNNDSGTFHLVDLNLGKAEIVGQSYPGVGPEQVGEIQVVSYPAADGMTIPGYLTLPPGVSNPRGLPLVVMPHGGPAARDSFGFDWWAQAMASRGYAVLQPNFRGSDGLGEAHLTAGYGEWGRKMQTDLSDGVRWLAAEGIIDPARVCIVGASYGGYAAMAGPTLDRGIYRCAVSVAGVSDLNRMIQWSAERGGRRNSPAVRYWIRFMGADGYNDDGLDQWSPARQAALADAPILLIHGRDDTVVPYEQSEMLASALRQAGKPHEMVELDGEDHWLSGAETRTRMLTETLHFLETHNPPR